MNSFLEIDKMLNARQTSQLEFQKKSQNETHLIIQSPTDLGVCRNGGRRGSSFAPEAILNLFRKITSTNSSQLFYSQIVTNSQIEKDDFQNSQRHQQERISTLLDSTPAGHILHLGGGHDHVFPFLCAIAKKHEGKNIAVVNIDAHLDTRDDDLKHSGTPFRQFLEQYPNTKLFQFGIHQYTNPASNFEKLSTEMDVTTSQEIQSMSVLEFKNYLEKKFSDLDDMIWVLSLDSDALHSSVMEAVSAVNHNGLTTKQILTIMEYVGLKQKENKYFGIYEYNPLYDNQSQKGARTIVDLLTHWIL